MTTTEIQPANPASAAHGAPAESDARGIAESQNLTLLVLLAGIFMTTLDRRSSPAWAGRPPPSAPC